MRKAIKAGILISISLLSGLSIWFGVPILYGFISNRISPKPTQGMCYATEGFSWPSGNARVWINETSVPKYVNWDFDVQNAIQQYNQVHAGLFTATTNPPGTTIGGPQVTVSWGHLAQNGTELGLSLIYSSGKIEDSATVTLDLGTANWSDNGNDPQVFFAGDYSVTHVLLHEFGHVAGLAHSTCISEVMFPTTKACACGNTLGTWDMAGVKAIYH